MLLRAGLGYFIWQWVPWTGGAVRVVDGYIQPMHCILKRHEE